LKLIEPYQKDKTNLEELEYLLFLGMFAWNLAVYKKKDMVLHNTYRTVVIHDAALDSGSLALVNRIKKEKEKNYGNFEIILEDFDITVDAQNRASIMVKFIPFDLLSSDSLMHDFLDSLEEDLWEDEDDEDDDDLPDYILPAINRHAIVIKPKAPFYDWLKLIYFPDDIPAEGTESNVYLVQELQDKKAVIKCLKNNFDRIFCSELSAWNINEDAWPKSRTYKMFTGWFDAEIHYSVNDMERYPVRKEV
jgi:hypothetical protein